MDDFLGVLRLLSAGCGRSGNVRGAEGATGGRGWSRYLRRMRMSFKEWAVVVDALERGEQSLILRKGGIAEGRGGFRPEHDRFLLFPTQFHQQRDQVVPAAQRRYDELVEGWTPADRLRITSWAQVKSWQKLERLEDVEALRGQHVWKDSVITERFDWGREQAIYAIHLEVFRLARPWEGALLPGYGGCKSWVELTEDVSTEGSERVGCGGAPVHVST